MPYCTAADVRQVLSPGGDNLDDDTASGQSQEALADAITRAVATIHTYLGKRYALPVDPTADPDGILRDWCSVLAAWYATLTWSRGQDIGSDDPLRQRYNEVARTLDRVQSGNLTPAWPLETVNTADDVTIVNRYEGELFNADDFDLADSRRPYGWGILPGWGWQ